VNISLKKREKIDDLFLFGIYNSNCSIISVLDIELLIIYKILFLLNSWIKKESDVIVKRLSINKSHDK